MKRPEEGDADVESPQAKRMKGGGKGKSSSRNKGDGKGISGKGGLGYMRRCAFKVLCTDPYAANLIGPKGSTRAAIEEEASCCLWISKRDEVFPNPPFRLLILHADEPNQVLAALEKLVPKLVEVAERDREAGDESPLIGKIDGEYVFYVALPTLVRGKLLGTRGANIQELREQTGAKIFVENEAFDGHQAARIIGSPETISYVIRLLNEMVQEEAGSEEFLAWASTRTFGFDAKGGKGERGHSKHDSNPHKERATRSHSTRDAGPPFPEVAGMPLEAMGTLSFEFPEGGLELDHAISCELARDDVDGLLGMRNEHLPFLQRQTGTTIELSECESFCKILITGPLLNTYFAHFMLMKKFHDNHVHPSQVAQGENDRVEELKQQVAALQSQLESARRGGLRPTVRR